MKRSKRKRNPATSESDENTTSGSPEIGDQPKSEKSKKQKLVDSLPASSSVLEPLNKNEVLDTSVQTSGRQLRPRVCKRKSAGRQQPVRTTRSSRRKLISVPEDESKKQEELETGSEKCGTVVNTPKRATKKGKNKRTEFSQIEHVESNHIATVENQEVEAPVKQKFESVNQPMISSTLQAQTNQLCASDAPEILVPETPVLRSPAKLCKSTINVVLSPVVIKDNLEKEKNEYPCDEQESPSELNQNGRETEVLTSCQKSPGHVSESTQLLNEFSYVENEVLRESQEKISKKRKSSAAFDTADGNMQISESVNDGEDKKEPLVSSTTPLLGEKKKMRTKEQPEVEEIKESRKNNKLVEETDHNTSVQESSIISSTVKSPEKKNRRSSRWVRKSLKSSVRRHSSITQNTKNLVKSSIKLKLNHKKLMPKLKISLDESSNAALNDTHRMSACSVQFDGIKQNLFGADEKSENEKSSGTSSDDQSAGAGNDSRSSESSDNANRYL
mgnify:CR=1 FL=1